MEARDTIAAAGMGGTPHPLAAASPRRGEKIIFALLGLCTVVSVLTTTGIVLSLVSPTADFFGEVSIGDFLSTGDWAPLQADPSFGALRVVAGTFVVTLWAMLFAVPLGLGAAVYLSEYATPRVRRVLKPVIEVLAGVPTVALGLFALTFLSPTIQDLFPDAVKTPPFLILAGSLGIALLVLPIIASISDDAMRAVPSGLREGAYGLGATKMKVTTRVVFPAAISGIVASIVLAISRAVGETMVVLLAVGKTPNLTLDPFQSAQTMTAFIATTATGDAATGTTAYNTLFAVGALLFVITLLMNFVAIRLVRRFREVYE